VTKQDQRIIPGFYPDGFDKKEAVGNTIGHVLTRRKYQRKYKHELYVCGLDQIE